MAAERRLASAIQHVCMEGGLCSRDTLTYLLSLWIGRLTYYSHSTEYLLDDAEFGDGDRVTIYLKRVDTLNDLPFVLDESIAWWLRWGEGRQDRYLTQAYGF